MIKPYRLAVLFIVGLSGCRGELIEVSSQTQIFGNSIFVTAMCEESLLGRVNFNEFERTALRLYHMYKDSAEIVQVTYYKSDLFVDKEYMDMNAADPKVDIFSISSRRMYSFNFRKHHRDKELCSMYVSPGPKGRSFEVDGVNYNPGTKIYERVWKCDE